MDVTPFTEKNEGSTSRKTSPISEIPSVSLSIDTGAESPDTDLSPYNVTVVLTYCKTKILKPYLRLLSITGLRSFTNDSNETVTISACCSYIYMFALLLLMIAGYILQYMACFRRDRGFGYMILESSKNKFQPTATIVRSRIYENICNDSIVFSYAIPHVLHLLGYVYAFLIFRSSDDDQLPSLMETVFLSLSNLTNGFQSQKRLIKILWVFVGTSLFWMVLSLVTVNIMMGEGMIEFRWLNGASSLVTISMKLLLVIATLWHDVIQATVISNYCLQAQLLTSYMHFLREKLIQNLSTPLEWMKDIEEFRKLLKFLNNKLAPSVCLLTLVNMSRSITGILWLLNLGRIDKYNTCAFGINILNVILWLLLTLAPFIQAARLTSVCETIKSTGHEIRVRPFAHQGTPAAKLDSVLMFASNLKLNAKLFGIPMKQQYLYFILSICIIYVIVYGQLH